MENEKNLAGEAPLEAVASAETCSGCDRACSFDAVQCGLGARLASDQGVDARRDDDAQLAHLFHRCSHMLMYRRGQRGGRSGLLMVLARHGALSQRDIAEKLDIRPSSASELLAKMEAAGFVTRTPDEEDKRAMTVSLTEEGRQEVERIHRERAEANQSLFEALDEDEKKQLAVALGKLTDSWRSSFAADMPRGRGKRSSGKGGHGNGHGCGHGRAGHRGCEGSGEGRAHRSPREA